MVIAKEPLCKDAILRLATDRQVSALEIKKLAM